MASLRQPDKAYWDNLIGDRPFALPGTQRDPTTGAPYIMSKGKKQYLSPEMWGDRQPADTTGILRSDPRWNPWKGKWETPVDWGNIVTMGTAGLLTAGAANALMAGPVAAPTGTTAAAASSGAPAAAAGGVLPSTTIGTGMIGPVGGTGISSATALSGGAAAGGNAALDALKKTGKQALGGGGSDGGMDYSELVKLALLQGGLGALGGLLDKDQERQSFRGTSADPVKMMTGAQDAIKEFQEPLMTRLRTPVNIPGASAPSTRYSGGPLPFEVGVEGSVPDRQTNTGADSRARAEKMLSMLQMGKR